MKLWCYFIVWMPPPTPTPPTTHISFPLLTLAPPLLIFPVSSPNLSPMFYPGSMPLHADVKSPRLCSPLCSDHLWQIGEGGGGALCSACCPTFPPSCYHPLWSFSFERKGGKRRAKRRQRRLYILTWRTQRETCPCHWVVVSRNTRAAALSLACASVETNGRDNGIASQKRKKKTLEQRASLDLKCDCHWQLCHWAP